MLYRRICTSPILCVVIGHIDDVLVKENQEFKRHILKLRNSIQMSGHGHFLGLSDNISHRNTKRKRIFGQNLSVQRLKVFRN